MVYEKSLQFAIQMVELYKDLIINKKEYVLSKQILKSGTSIGSNIREALEGQSRKDFIAKLYIALKEAGETQYWIELLIATNYLDKEKGDKLSQDVIIILKLLNAIIKTCKKVN